MAREALANYPHQTAILVGAGYSMRNGATERRAVYQLLPGSDSPPRLLEVVSKKDTSVVVNDLQAGWPTFIFRIACTLLVLALLGVIWKRDLTTPPNNSFNGDVAKATRR